MRILLFGGSGQLGYELITRAHDLNFDMIAPVISEVDIADRAQVMTLTERLAPELVINAAAYTAVDKAEQEREEAFRVNRDGARYVAEAAKAARARHFYISTDYVFFSHGPDPLSESLEPNPPNVYGASKLAGEQAVLEVAGDDALVIRTSSLHGRRGENFVHTMLRLFEERDVVKVVADQIMSPTWAGWLAEVLLDLSRIPCSGIVHACCAGAISWHEFASAIFEEAQPKAGGVWRARLEPTTSAELARPAPRSPYSVLDTTRLAGLLGRPALPWQRGLQGHLRDIGRLREERQPVA